MRLEWAHAFTGELASVAALPIPEVREWALGGATGAGITVAIVDSGVDAYHPAVGRVESAVAFVVDEDEPDGVRAEEGPHEDLVGHGTACAAIIRSLAPDVELVSVRVLGANLKGRGRLLAAGIDWVIEQGIEVANLSLSSKAEGMYAPLHELADAAYFGNTMLVCAANNLPGPTYPAEYASVVSVAAMPGDDPWALSCNPSPPVEFGARGIEMEVAWSAGSTTTATGNSFAAPHVAAMSALIRSKHPDLRPYQVKTLLQAMSSNAVVAGAN